MLSTSQFTLPPPLPSSLLIPFSFIHVVLLFLFCPPFVVCYSTATALATDEGYYERHIGQTALLKCVIEGCIPGAKCHVQWIHPDMSMMTHETKGEWYTVYIVDLFEHE